MRIAAHRLATISIIGEQFCFVADSDLSHFNPCAKLSGHAFDRWNEIKEQHRTIGDVRGLGLMIGIELVKEDGHTPDEAAFPALGTYALEHNMLILPCGPDSNIIRFIPPLNVSTEELDLGIDTLADAIAVYES